VGLLGPCGAFTRPRRPLTFPSSPAGTPESESDIRPMCCSVVGAPCGAPSRSGNLRARGTLLRPAGKSRTGMSPRTPSIVSRTCKPKPAGRAPGNLVGNSCARAPFRLLPIRAPRQAVLRTSSRLAPSLVANRPCDLPAEKTRDASNRCLPPKRIVCTRTSRVPGSLSQLSPRGCPTETQAPSG
jgi:hypothetical protein